MTETEGAAVSVVTYWCMDLFFLLAGASTWLALRKKTARQFLTERLRRLLVPLVAGFLLLVPVQTYFEWVSAGRYSGTLDAFYPFFLGNIFLNGQYAWIVSSIHHLWFLAYLFAFSLVTLPLCLCLRSERGMIWIERLAALCKRPGGFFLPILPLIGAQIGLHALYPVYCGPADALCWLLFYLAGYVLFSHSDLRYALYQQKRLATGLALAGLVSMFILGQAHQLHRLMTAPDYSWDCLSFQVLFILTLWSSLLVILAAGEKYLNRRPAFVSYASLASFSWYLLHFPIVIIVAYYVLPLHLPAPVIFSLISSATLVITAGLAHLLLSINGLLAQPGAKVLLIVRLWLKPQRANLVVNRTAPLKI